MTVNKIDYLVFEHVFENDKGYVDYLKEHDKGTIIKSYSTDIKYALEVVDKMNLTITPRWRVFKANTRGSRGDINYIGTTNHQEWTQHESLPMAICLAALKVKGIDNLEDEANKIVDEINELIRQRREELEKLGIKFD